MINQLGLVIDRVHLLMHDPDGISGAERAKLSAKTRVLWLRARITRAAIASAVLSVLLAALLISSPFVRAILTSISR